MVIDSSAIIAILCNEDDMENYISAIEQEIQRHISASTLLETALVIGSKLGEDGLRELDLLIYKAEIKIKEFDLEQEKIARKCFLKYGKGRHKANLNYGDCFSYALAKILDEKLLFKGKDFSLTDIEPAI